MCKKDDNFKYSLKSTKLTMQKYLPKNASFLTNLNKK